MRLTIARAWLAAAMLLAGAGPVPAQPRTPPPVEDYTRPAEIADVDISPSGRRLAVLSFGPQGRRRLGVMDLDPPGHARIVADYAHADVSHARWINDERLVYFVAEPGPWVRPDGAGTFAVNHDGSDRRELIGAVGFVTSAGTGAGSRRLPWEWSLHSVVGDGSADIFVMRGTYGNTGELKDATVARQDTLTGLWRPLSLGTPAGTRDHWFDTRHELRMVSTWRAGRTQLHWREPGGDRWQEVADFDELADAGLTPWHIDAEGQVVVQARVNGDTIGLYRFDPKARRLDPQPLVAVNGFDLDEALPVTDPASGRLLGLHFVADRPMSVWFDERMQQLQRGLDAALPAGRSNRIYCGRCETTRFFVVRSSSDRQPGEYYLFDRDKGTLARIGAARPWIDEATQGRRTMHRVAMRDGLKIPVVVTDPPGAKPGEALPAVVLVHGGPWVRGTSVRWEHEAQFLASRGWRVLQPEFRGSTGYGLRLFRAGWKQWGRAMQDDLVDTVKWAAAQGGVDAARVCVSGASYGGYASLMAPIATPGVFRCAASYAGVTDIEQMYSISWSDISEASKRYSMPALIGSPDKDAALLAAASPLRRVAEIKVPVFLAHGYDDVRVPVAHARRFVKAAQAAGVAVEEVIYEKEGHGFYFPENEADFYRRLEAFLARSLSAPQ